MNISETPEHVAPAGRQTAALYNDQKLKLGLFAMNCDHGMLMTSAPGHFEATWENTREVVRIADKLGFEVALPLGRWRGFGGPSDFNGTSFETYTWAAGLAEATEQIMVFATSHVSTVHPVVAAKQAVTIDHISGGRFGLNLVMGWFRPEMEMFGASLLPHDERYAYGAEWLEIVKRIWTENEPFDHHGQYFRLNEVQAKPKPIQSPGPVLVNAGVSPAAAAFTSRNIDFCFATADTMEKVQANQKIKRQAREEHGRDVGILYSALLICRDTDKEAQGVFEQILGDGDWEAAANFGRVLGIESRSFTESLSNRERTFVAGAGSRPIIGSPERVAEELATYSDLGVDGLVFYCLDYESELEYFGERVMPLLKQAGLRH